MLSESTAQLVEGAVILGEPERARIKGAAEPVPVRRLMGISPRAALVGYTDTNLVGRQWELAALEAIVDRAIGGCGGVVNVVGPPGIGKSRAAREAAALAASRGVNVVWAFCESHASDLSFQLVARLLRAGTGVLELGDAAARARVREQIPDADPQDALLLDDLLGIRDGLGARFVKRYASLQEEMNAGVAAYTEDVRSRRYPGPEHTYSIDPSELAELRELLR